MLPATMVTDMGAEYKSDTFEQIAELGVTVVNLPSYRPELKGTVEKFFDLVQGLYKKHLKGKGVIEPDFQERGVHDYRRDACLTMADFERIIIHCIVYYNSRRVIEDFPFSAEMIAQKVAPNSAQIWNWGVAELGANLINVSYDVLMRTLLPRTTGRFSRRGLTVNKLRYRHDTYAERFLRGGTAKVAYNPDDASAVWLIEDGEYVRFDLVESRFAGKDLLEVQSMKSEQRILERSSADAKLYLAVLRSLQKKGAKLAVQQQNQNYKAVRGQEYSGILGGSDSFTIIGTSGIGKSSAISRALQLIAGDGVIEIDEPYARIMDVNEDAHQQIAAVIYGLLKVNPAPDKATNQLGWIQHMNMLKLQAEEIILRELIYT